MYYTSKEASLMENSIAAIVELLQPQRKKKNPQCSFVCGYVRMQTTRSHIHAHTNTKRVMEHVLMSKLDPLGKQINRCCAFTIRSSRSIAQCCIRELSLISPLLLRFICSLLLICIPLSQKYFVVRVVYKINNENFRTIFSS